MTGPHVLSRNSKMLTQKRGIDAPNICRGPRSCSVRRRGMTRFLETAYALIPSL
jgi:hypothetical protein